MNNGNNETQIIKRIETKVPHISPFVVKLNYK